MVTADRVKSIPGDPLHNPNVSSQEPFIKGSSFSYCYYNSIGHCMATIVQSESAQGRGNKALNAYTRAQGPSSTRRVGGPKGRAEIYREHRQRPQVFSRRERNFQNVHRISLIGLAFARLFSCVSCYSGRSALSTFTTPGLALHIPPPIIVSHSR